MLSLFFISNKLLILLGFVPQRGMDSFYHGAEFTISKIWLRCFITILASDLIKMTTIMCPHHHLGWCNLWQEKEAISHTGVAWADEISKPAPQWHTSFTKATPPNSAISYGPSFQTHDSRGPFLFKPPQYIFTKFLTVISENFTATFTFRPASTWSRISQWYRKGDLVADFEHRSLWGHEWG